MLHEMLGRIIGVEVSYTPIDLDDHPTIGAIEQLDMCKKAGFRGVNVTHPFKQDARAFCDDTTSLPTTLHSINTVLFNDSTVVGANTDYTGFKHAFQHKLDMGTPSRVFMLGAGGVGIAIATGLMELGLQELIISDPNEETLERTLKLFRDTSMTVTEAPHIEDAMQWADGLVNASPVGMHQYRGNPFPEQFIQSQSWAFDAVYTPENTDFLRSCRNRNIRTLSGFQLFFHQGIDAFQLFTGLTVDADFAERQFLQEHPLVLEYV